MILYVYTESQNTTTHTKNIYSIFLFFRHKEQHFHEALTFVCCEVRSQYSQTSSKWFYQVPIFALKPI